MSRTSRNVADFDASEPIAQFLPIAPQPSSETLLTDRKSVVTCQIGSEVMRVTSLDITHQKIVERFHFVVQSRSR